MMRTANPRPARAPEPDRSASPLPLPRREGPPPPEDTSPPGPAGRLAALCIAAALLALPGWAQEEGDAPETDTGGGSSVGGVLDDLHGSFSNRYRVRFADEASDNDLYQYLRLRYRDEYAPGISGSFHGRLTEDLDHGGFHNEFWTFNDILDTYNSAVNLRIYHATVNIRPDEKFLVDYFRAGRQQVVSGELFHMDGGHLVMRPIEKLLDLTVEGFVGVPVHMFESSPDGDFIAGAAASIRPWRGGYVRFDYTHLDDENRFYHKEGSELFSFSGRQILFDMLTARAEYQILDGESRMVRVGMDALLPEDLVLRAEYMGQLSREREQVYDLDPYYAILQDLDPYATGHFSASKGLGEHFNIEGGYTFRQLIHDSDESRFNHDFNRFYVTLATYAWPFESVSMSATADWWVSHDDTASFSGEIVWQATDNLRFTGGTDFALYRYDFYTGDERTDSQGVFLRTDWEPNDRWKFDLSLRYENDDYDSYGIIRTGFRFDF